VLLHEQDARARWVHCDAVNAVTDLGGRVGDLFGLQSAVDRSPYLAAVVAPKRARRRDGDENPLRMLRIENNGMQPHPARARLPEMALRFILSHTAVSTTIAGMRKPEHVRQDIAVSDRGPLDKSLLAELKKHRWDRAPQRWSD